MISKFHRVVIILCFDFLYPRTRNVIIGKVTTLPIFFAAELANKVVKYIQEVLKTKLRVNKGCPEQYMGFQERIL